MALDANSTRTPGAPPCPLSSEASQAWRDLWAQVDSLTTDEKGATAVLNAYSAGVEIEHLCAIQLKAPKDRLLTMPRLWFGPNMWGPCRIFSPLGEVEQ